MGFAVPIVVVAVSFFIAGGFQFYYRNLTPLPVPALEEFNQYWGPGDASLYKEDSTIKPFKISYSADIINKLRSKLDDLPKLVTPIEETAFEYGFNSHKLQEILKYWRSDYLNRWDERESFLNQFPHFKTQIQGLDIHFIHLKPKVPEGTKVFPLLLLHGWPGSVREFYDIIPKLTSKSADKDFVFEVVVPSLPGYGWSQGATKKGLGGSKIAVIMHKLMIRLGYQKYYVQGGDWGAFVGKCLATFYQDNVLGVHLNMCAVQSLKAIFKTILVSYMPSFFVDEKYVEFYYPALPKLKQMIVESGYMHLQATKPDTIGTALVGNPVGLAAYILEKFSTWTNPIYRELPDGGLQEYFTLDSLLDNIMIYYLTDSITTSQRLYYESFSAAESALQLDRIPTSVPAGCAKFKYELFHSLDWAIKDHFVNLIQSNHFADGGHFAAMQLPNVLYKDVVDFVSKTLQTKKL